MINPWIIVAVMVAISGAGYQGYRMGQSACKAAYNAAELKRVADFEAEKLKRIEAERERNKLALELERENNEEPIVVTQCLGPNRLRLINRVNQ